MNQETDVVAKRGVLSGMTREVVKRSRVVKPLNVRQNSQGCLVHGGRFIAAARRRLLRLERSNSAGSLVVWRQSPLHSHPAGRLSPGSIPV